MGKINRFTKEKLITGILTSVPESLPEAVGYLEKEFGPVDFKSSLLDFEYTNYYIPEMGSPIKRIFLSFENLVDPGDFARLKVKTNILEEKFTISGKRKMNFDPGLLSLERFMLATTKNTGHRVPLHDGIYAEVTLLFENRHFVDLPWTYPDYASREYKEILSKIREIYKDNLKQKGRL